MADAWVSAMQQILEDNWDQHWSEFGELSMQRPASKYRTRLILQLLELEKAQAPVQVLDIGSGTGDFAAEFHAQFPNAEFTGIELSRTGVAIASKRVPSGRFLQRNLLAPELENVPEPQATHAVCSEVLEHLDVPEQLLRNASLYLATGCRLVVTVPAGPMSEFYRHIGHRRHYTKDSLRALLELSGFAVDRVLAPGFPFFNLYRILVTMRGARLIGDVSQPASRTPWHVRAGMVVFDWLFRFNLMRWGWQIIAVAHWPGR
jgi:SAM-dependent methyltransferase